MISSAMNIAVSGLQASGKRMAVSANNVANMNSTLTSKNGQTVKEPFIAQQVNQTSLASGGVKATTRPVDPPYVEVYDADDAAAGENGVTKYPNVNLEEEVVNQITASYDYKANLKVIKRADEMMKSLLDIKA